MLPVSLDCSFLIASRMNNPEKQAGAIKNEQSRETDRSNQE
jgi:hypothetical protein